MLGHVRTARSSRLCYAGGMDDRMGKDAKAKAPVAAALDGTLSDVQAAELAALDPRIQKLA